MLEYCELNLRLHKRPQTTIPYVSERLNVTPSYLSSLFKREVVENLTRCLLQIRLNQVKLFLCDTDQKITRSVGYYRQHPLFQHTVQAGNRLDAVSLSRLSLASAR